MEALILIPLGIILWSLAVYASLTVLVAIVDAVLALLGK